MSRAWLPGEEEGGLGGVSFVFCAQQARQLDSISVALNPPRSGCKWTMIDEAAPRCNLIESESPAIPSPPLASRLIPHRKSENFIGGLSLFYFIFFAVRGFLSTENFICYCWLGVGGGGAGIKPHTRSSYNCHQ